MKTCCVPTRSANKRGKASGNQLEQTTFARDDLMVSLPGGRFLMGTDYPEGFPLDGEGPIRPVRISPFAIDATPVTNEQFAKFVAETKYITDAERFGWSFVFWAQIPRNRFRELVEDTVAAAPWWCKVPGAIWAAPEGPGSNISSRQDHPVVHVSHNDALANASWAGKILPTEAEWEFACRAESVDEATGTALQKTGWFSVNSDGHTHEVGAKQPNAYGLYDMRGNVWEYCADNYHAGHIGAPEVGSAWLSKGKQVHVLRGGSWQDSGSLMDRRGIASDKRDIDIGFRVVAKQRVH